MTNSPVTAASLLIIIDDQKSSSRLLQTMLGSAGYTDIRGITDPQNALAVCRERKPDLILLDLQKPYITGLPFIKLLLQEFSEQLYFPILLLTADLTPESKRKALACGAKDLLGKPFDSEDLLLRILNLLKTGAFYGHFQPRNRLLERNSEVLQSLALAAEYRDDETGQHTQRVGHLAAIIAEQIGQSPEDIDLLRAAAPLHDIGKIGIADRILLKPGRLTSEEFTIMKAHTLIGEQIFSRCELPVMKIARQIALSHHERWDGTGYPHGLAGDSIPLAARITAIADVFDALTHARPYKEAWPVEKALETIEQDRGKHFDPALASAFLSAAAVSGLANLAERVAAGNHPPRKPNVKLWYMCDVKSQSTP